MHGRSSGEEHAAQSSWSDRYVEIIGARVGLLTGWLWLACWFLESVSPYVSLHLSNVFFFLVYRFNCSRSCQCWMVHAWSADVRKILPGLRLCFGVFVWVF